MTGGKTKKVKKGSSKKASSRKSDPTQSPQQPYPQYPPPPQYPQYPQPAPGYPLPAPGYQPPAPGYPPQAPGYPPQAPGYPPQAPTPGYSPYPQYPYYPPQPYRRNSALSAIIAIALIIIIIIIAVVIAGVLYTISTYDEDWYDDEYYSSTKISAIKTEKSNAFVISITSVSGSNLWLDKANFEITDDNDILKYHLTIFESNPDYVSSGQSIIYPMTHTSTAVTDAAGGALDSSDSLHDYTNCTIAYIDQNDDGKVTADDSIWIYKDNNNDSIDDVGSRYSFRIIDDYDEMVLQKQL